MQEQNGNIAKSMAIARDLIGFAEQGQAASNDDGCLLLYGLVRDCGYKIMSQAERERQEHRSRGVWSEGE